jgi:hypothetical protein
MAKWLDWLITGVILAMVLMAQYRLVFAGVFDPFPLAAGVSLLILVRIVHHHAPKWIAAKYKRK